MPKNPGADNPATTSAAHAAMTMKWADITTVLAGTKAMRAARTKYLPQHEHESDFTYRNRLKTAVLYNVTELTLDAMVGRPFSDPVVLNDDIPAQIEELMPDIDLQGNDLNTFVRDVFEDGFTKGFTHVMVEFPRLDKEDRTLADDREEQIRPYWVKINPENLIFAFVQVVNGKEILTHVRMVESVKEQDGFTEVIVEQIRVLDLLPEGVFVRLYRKLNKTKDKWFVFDSWMMDIDFIPLATFYANRKGFMLAKPPLEDLVALNIRHWQSSSDQENSMTVARFPILAASGVPPKPSQNVQDADDVAVVIGPFNILQAKNPDAKFYYVEHEGKAIEAGEKSIERIEGRMAEYGAAFLKKKPGNPTATARALDSAEATSPLQDVTNRFVSFVNTLLGFTAAWLKLEEGGTISISTDFGPEEFSTSDMTALVEARKNRDLSRLRFLLELRRRAVLEDDFDTDENEEELEGEVLSGMPEVDLDPGQEEE